MSNSMPLSDAIVSTFKTRLFAAHPAFVYRLYREKRDGAGFIDGKSLKFNNCRVGFELAKKLDVADTLIKCVVDTLREIPTVSAWLVNRHGERAYSVVFAMKGFKPQLSHKYFEVHKVELPAIAPSAKKPRTPKTSKDNAKYEFVATDFIRVRPKGYKLTVTLHRIRALQDIPGIVKAGELGGYIQGQHNLETTGRCWVAGQAKVGYCASVSGHAFVSEDAQVFGEHVIIASHAHVRDSAKILGRVHVFARCVVEGVAEISGDVEINDHAHIYQAAKISGHVRVAGHAHVSGSARLSGYVHVHGDAHIGGDANVSGAHRDIDGFTFIEDGFHVTGASDESDEDFSHPTAVIPWKQVTHADHEDV